MVFIIAIQGFGGVLQKRAKVVLVGILLNYGKASGSFEEETDNWTKLLECLGIIKDIYSMDLQISSTVFAIDPDYPTSVQMKSFRALIAEMKTDICKVCFGELF